MALATLSIDIEAKLANLEAGMDKAARLAEKNAAATEAAWKRAGSTLAGIGASVAGAFAAFNLIEFVRGNIDALDALNDVSDATGASIENISALEDVAKRTGATMDTVTTALIKLNGALAEAKPDSPTARALRGIGLDVERLKSLDPAEALRQVAVALSGYADDGNKARLVQELFGKSLREVAPLLKDLASQTQLLAKTTTEQAKEAEKFNLQLFELKANAAGAARSLVADLVPAMNNMFARVKEDGGFFAAFWKDIKLGVLASDAQLASSELAKLTKQLQAGMAIPEDKRTMLQQARIRELRSEIDALTKSAAVAADAYRKLAGGLPEKSKSEREAAARRADKSTYELESVGDIGKETKTRPVQAEQISEAQRALAAYVAELQKELDKTTELSEQQKTLNLLRSLGAAGEVPQVRELVLGLERRITLAKQDNAIREDNLRIIKEQEAAQRSLNDEIYKLSGRADDARKVALTKTLEDQLNSGTEYSAAELEKIVKGIAGISDQAAQTFGELDELTKEFGRNVQDALGDTILSTLKGDFDNILSLWGNMLLKMASQALAADLGKTLFGNLFGSSGAGAGQLGGAFGDFIQFIGSKMPFALAAGGVVDGPTITQFAAGGVFDRATRFSYGGGNIGELGEAGPEAVMPLRRGRDGKLGVAAAGGAGPTIVFNIASGVTRPELQAMVPALTEQIKAEVRAGMRRPGGGY